MKNFIEVVAVFLLFTSISFAQTLEKDQYFGTIVTLDGDEKTGVIKINQSQGAYNWQEKIMFHETDTTTHSKKLKNRDFEKFKPKALAGYRINEKVFEVIDYNNSESLTNQLLKAGGNNIFAEVVFKAEKLSIYNIHSKPVSGGVIAGGDLVTDGSTESSQYLVYAKSDEKAKEFASINISKYFEDCQTVVDKFENGEFIRKPKKKGLKHALKEEFIGGQNQYLAGQEYFEAAVEIAKAYNQSCLTN